MRVTAIQSVTHPLSAERDVDLRLNASGLLCIHVCMSVVFLVCGSDLYYPVCEPKLRCGVCAFALFGWTEGALSESQTHCNLQ